MYVILRDSLKEMMTPELANKTLQLYTGLVEDFFGLEARAPEVRCCAVLVVSCPLQHMHVPSACHTDL